MPDLSAKHPSYSATSADWTLMRDSYRGARQVKSKGGLYLPPTKAHLLDGYGSGQLTTGQKDYEAYKLRARFPNFVREAVQMAIGMMHSQPPIIEMPKVMKGIKSSKGEPLEHLLRKINTEQLITGRIGVMADLPTNPTPGDDIPYLTTYSTERVINWDDGGVEQIVPQTLNFVVIDESENQRIAGFDWEIKTKYRVLIIGDDLNNETKGLYTQAVFEENTYNVSMMKAPSWKGRTLEKIPFVFVNSCDITSEVDDPPLLDLGDICMAIYRGEADYRHNLYMQGQDTLVTIGGGFDETDKLRVGAGARLDMPLGADAKYIGVTSSGLQEQREALARLESRAGSMGAQTLDTTSRERESGDSLRIRVAARTADMNQIVDAGALALENILKTCAEWMGENPDEVKVKPNKEFGEMPLTGQTMVEMATARNLGFPISARTMHDLARKRRMTTRTFEEEIAEAKNEDSMESFPFEKADTGDSADDQPNKDPDNPRSGKKVSEPKQKPAE
jgi:hypothetical protein